jgi:aminoglycoside N3'-acetyltransferase
MRERHYVEALPDYEGTILLVGVNYDKETREHTCVIEKHNRSGK